MTTPRPGAGGLRGYVLACLAFILVIAAGCAFAALAGQGAPVGAPACQGQGQDVLLTEAEAEGLRTLIREQAARQQIDAAAVDAALSEARSANVDVCAWLLVPGTNVSLPVARRAGDDGYYIDHDCTGAASPLGCAYVETENSPDFDDPVTVVHAHTFKGYAVMFNDLHRFEWENFFRENDSFVVVTPYEHLSYRIVSAGLYADDRIMSAVGASDEGALQDYYEFVHMEPEYGYARDAARPYDADARIVQLSTCTLDADAGVRFVVTGVLVDGGQ